MLSNLLKFTWPVVASPDSDSGLSDLKRMPLTSTTRYQFLSFWTIQPYPGLGIPGTLIDVQGFLSWVTSGQSLASLSPH